MTSLLDRGLSPVTVNSNFRSVKAFYNFLDEEGVLERNPFKNFKMLKEEKKIVPTFNREQIRKLLKMPNKKTFTGYRDYVIILFLLETGVRIRELCDMTLDDIDWRDNLVKIKGKNGSERYVPFTDVMKRELRSYVELRGMLNNESLWVTIDNTPLSRRQVQQWLQYYGKLANIKNVRVSPHTFRHTFARMSVENGANIFALQSVLGHSTLEMVRRYVNLFSKDVSKDHAKFSPLKGLVN